MRGAVAVTLSLTLGCSAVAAVAGTRIEAGGQVRDANDLRQGDPVTVTYTNRDGKIVAQSVTVNNR